MLNVTFDRAVYLAPFQTIGQQSDSDNRPFYEGWRWEGRRGIGRPVAWQITQDCRKRFWDMTMPLGVVA